MPDLHPTARLRLTGAPASPYRPGVAEIVPPIPHPHQAAHAVPRPQLRPQLQVLPAHGDGGRRLVARFVTVEPAAPGHEPGPAPALDDGLSVLARRYDLG